MAIALRRTAEGEQAEKERIEDERKLAKEEGKRVAREQRDALREDVTRLSLMVAKGRIKADEECEPWFAGSVDGEPSAWPASTRFFYRMAQLQWQMTRLAEFFFDPDTAHWCDPCHEGEEMPKVGWVKRLCVVHAERYCANDAGMYLVMMDAER